MLRRGAVILTVDQQSKGTTMARDRRFLIAGNWKMNGLLQDGVDLAKAVAAGSQGRKSELLICPPATLIKSIADALDGADVAVGGQDSHYESSGAYTGDVSAAMLKDLGCGYVILGHSERRAYHGESDEEVKAKAEAAHAAGLVAIICLGETAEQRDASETLSVISTQLYGSVPENATPGNTVIAYEPVWAIGTGRTATPEQAQDVHDHIRTYGMATFGMENWEGVRILYGGSMKPSNAAELLSQPDVDGGLIGGASLKAEDFLAIADAADALM